MWIFPCISKNTDFEIVERNGSFSLLQYSPGIMKAIAWKFTKKGDENPIDRDPSKFRIIIMKDGDPTVLAVSDSKECIEKHWEYVIQRFLPAIQAIELQSEAFHFIIAKVESLAKVEEEESGKKDTKLELFRENFPELEAEKFVTYYDGLFWESGKITPLRGTIYLLEESMAFHSPPNYKAVIQYYDISSITKEKTFGIISNSIKICTKENIDYWMNVVKRDAMYQAMEHLWRDAMKKWQITLDPDGLGRVATQDFMGTSITQFDQFVKIQEFQTTFKVPESPLSENDIYKAILRPPVRWLMGQLYLTENFICYRSKEVNPGDEVKIVIAFVNILEVTPIDQQDTKVLEFPTMKGIKIVSQSSNEFIFCVVNRNAVILKMIDLWNARLYYRKKQCRKSVSNFISHNGWTMDEIQMSDEIYRSQQDAKKKIWDKYFSRHGFMDDPVISNRFTNQIQKEGIPDIYRGRLWQICSGSLHKLETQPGYYVSLLHHKEGTPTIEAEIARDVTRSLPYHSFFKSGEGVSQLNNVLVAYSRRAHHIGYCQAMNIVAATLLLYMSEEEAFWLLCSICEEIIPEHYTKGLQLMGSVVEQQIFTELTNLYFPEVKHHLEEIGTPVEMLTLPWFMTFFIGYIPWRAALRVLDLVFIMGPDVLFLVGMSVLHQTKDKLLLVGEGTNVTPLFKEACVNNPEELIQDALSRSSMVTKESIQVLRQKKKFEMMRTLQENNLRDRFEEMAKNHPKIKQVEFNNIYKEFEKLAVIKTTDKVSDTVSLRSTLIDSTQFQKLLCHFIPHLEEKYDLNVPIMLLLFKRGDQKDKQVMNFEEFIQIFEILWRGTPAEQFNLCFSILHDTSDKITKPQFRTLINVIYRMTYAGSTPWEQNSLRIDMFVDIVYESLKGHQESLTYAEISEMILDKGLLADFWKGM